MVIYMHLSVNMFYPHEHLYTRLTVYSWPQNHRDQSSPKMNKCPLKRDHFKRKGLSTNHPFQGTFLSFRGSHSALGVIRICQFI